MQAKLTITNSQLSVDDREEANVVDYFMTEHSLKRGFASVFGAPCDVIATMLYMKASNSIDYCKLSFADFYELVSPLMVSTFRYSLNILTYRMTTESDGTK